MTGYPGKYTFNNILGCKLARNMPRLSRPYGMNPRLTVLSATSPLSNLDVAEENNRPSSLKR